MSKNDIGQSVVDLLRMVSLGRLDPEIAIDQPIGRQELGLDSLALFEFVAALEKKFSVEIPDSIWKKGARLTPSDLVNVIMELHPLPAENKASIHMKSLPQLAASASYMERISAFIRNQGILAASRWVMQRVSRRFIRSIHATDVHVILQHDLDYIPDYRTLSKTDLQFREAFKADLTSLESFWAPHLKLVMSRSFTRRLDAGACCLTAWRDEEIVGIDYLSSASSTDPETGLEIKMLPGSCYALDLYEKYPGEGIGSALLGYSLAETKRRGFKRQVTIVHEENLRMLISTIQIFGFKEIGRVRSQRLCGHVRSEWFIENQPQQGRTVVI